MNVLCKSFWHMIEGTYQLHEEYLVYFKRPPPCTETTETIIVCKPRAECHYHHVAELMEVMLCLMRHQGGTQKLIFPGDFMVPI